MNPTPVTPERVAWNRSDLVGKTFGRLTVVAFHHSDGKRVHWLCKCVCGRTRVVKGNRLKGGHTVSCGCARGQKPTHGLSGTRFYYQWDSMIRRCNDPKREDYKHYGARGITVCKEWLNIETFLADMGYPLPGMTIERIDNDKGYCKENCRWATQAEQTRNTRRNIWLVYNGVKMPLLKAAEQSGIPWLTLYHRNRRNTPPERLFLPHQEFRYGEGSNWKINRAST